jgi:formate-dependent nitrite reductase membrane component NrfD
VTDSITQRGTEMRSYYGRPVIKEPVWQPEIPWYFFTGGLAGASAVLGLGARLADNDELADKTLWISLAADVASPILLISDLGRPERFLNMLRVFKVTSPMSVGSWILAASGAVTTAAAGAHVLGLRKTRDFFEALSMLLGLPLATYTGVLVADTAVPVWHEARKELPFVFGAGAAASAGAAGALVTRPANAGPARRLAVASALTETALTKVMERKLGFVGEVYHEEEAGKYGKLATGLTVAGAAVLGLTGRTRLGAVAGSSLILAGTAAMRWSVFKAGFQSARDPRYTVEPQRERRAEAK